MKNVMLVCSQLLQSGNNPLGQIAMGLARYRKYRDPEIRATTKVDLLEDVHAEADRKRTFGNGIQACATSLKRVVTVKRSKTEKAICDGVTITNK